MVTELTEMRPLRFVLAVVPVAHVNHPEALVDVVVRPADEAPHGSVFGLGTEQPSRLRVAHVQGIGQRIVRSERRDEVALQTLTEQERARHVASVPRWERPAKVRMRGR
jgi:hypothetical protein